MKNYWIALLTSMTLFGVVYTFNRSKKESDQPQLVALGSLIHTETLKSKTVVPIKEHKTRVLRKVYTKDVIDSLKLPSVNQKFLTAMEHQLVFLKKANDQKYGNLAVEVEEMTKVLDVLRTAKSSDEIAGSLDAYQICGDGKGNVLYTGYYSPTFSARSKQDDTYHYGICIAQSGDNGCKMAYLRDAKQIEAMRTEGIAFLLFADGKKELVAYDKEFKVVVNEKKAESHDLLTLESESTKSFSATYAKFSPNDKPRPVGAAKVPLTKDYSIAVDQDYIPLGSVLLAEVPVLDEQGNFVRYDYRFVLAQDTGGKIDGANHIDLYMGEGDSAGERTKYMSKFGRLWLLLPKENTEPKLLADNIK